MKEEPKAGLCSKGPAVVTKVVVQKAQGLEEKTGKEGDRLNRINSFNKSFCDLWAILRGLSMSLGLPAY